MIKVFFIFRLFTYKHIVAIVLICSGSQDDADVIQVIDFNQWRERYVEDEIYLYMNMDMASLGTLILLGKYILFYSKFLIFFLSFKLNKKYFLVVIESLISMHYSA